MTLGTIRRDQLGRDGAQVLTMSQRLKNVFSPVEDTPALPFSFEWDNVSITVTGGRWRIPGRVVVTISDTTFNLSGLTEYIYTRLKKDLSTGDITHSASEPAIDDGTYYNWLLAKMTAAGSGYELTVKYYAGGDIQIMAPLV